MLGSGNLLPAGGYGSSDLGQIKSTWTALTPGAESFFPTAQGAAPVAPHSGIKTLLQHRNSIMAVILRRKGSHCVCMVFI